jgi:hypothetical protein
MRVLFLFLDGVGLGSPDPAINPLAAAEMPVLRRLLDGSPLVAGRTPVDNTRATLLALDATLGVAGLPQSATGQAALLTGKNIPAAIGEHYGPKPNPAIKGYLNNGNLFSSVAARGQRAALLNAYPPRYFEAIESGRRLPGAIAMAARYAGLALKTKEDLFAGQALSVDFTGLGWRESLGFHDTPLFTPEQAGQKLRELAVALDFSIFEYWLSDMVGHKQDMEAACAILHTLDRVLGTLIDSWQDEQGLILVTSDHGNLEDITTRRHTANPVPCLLIGSAKLRRQYASRLSDLTDVYDLILSILDPGKPFSA